ncbi:MAG: hypothetical protein RLY66_99 [Candidatus Parcubacteria bacterium]|jgi:hypothetical protein
MQYHVIFGNVRRPQLQPSVERHEEIPETHQTNDLRIGGDKYRLFVGCVISPVFGE